MNYLSVTNLTKYYGERCLFENITFYIDKGQKLALIAKNGTGKSSLLKILEGQEPPESGEYKIHKDINCGFLAQEPEFDEQHTVFDAILYSDNPMLKASLEYEHALAGIGNLEDAIDKMDKLFAWDYEKQVKQILSKFLITDFDQKVASLSGGQKKRLALARLLLNKPDLLILDEPTNHLDMDMIEWLETELSKQNITLLMITHDRYFLENICTDILELEDNKLYKHKGNYSVYLENKAIREENARVSVEHAQSVFRKELEWMRRQPKARTTKAKSRIDNFEQVKEKAQQLVQEQQVQLELKMNRLGGKILELHNVSKQYGSKQVLDKFSYKFQRGERVGIVGRNGFGKSTLLNILTGLEKPDSGNIVLGETVVFGYYNQQGLQLKADKRVLEVVKDIAEYLPVNKGQISAAQLLERFLFAPSQQHQYVSTLSGGEKRRLYLLTILMKNPNFLILDEPTNDLDILTLQALEDFLSEYKGCLLIVSHDRYFLDKLTDHIFIIEEEGKIRDYLGNYKEYRAQKKAEEREKKNEEASRLNENKQAKNTDASKKKMTFKERQEFQLLENELQELADIKTSLTNALSSGVQTHEEITAASLELQRITELLDEKEMRWLELSEYQ
ncbi:MAG TPA: ABC-F family ATP-binding cassette domain-containing protein [Chitinophagales bacterium]|nr:ABC-F family ATP-binding cassette domain-containing protein [Chitinophagales bacterium]